MMGLAQAMYAVQEQLPSLLQGNPIHAPSTLVHEMFAKYSNGTKTEADLASIDKGLDELFFHDFSAEDNERLVDFIGAGDLFNQETITIQPPQIVSWSEERGREREMRYEERLWLSREKNPELILFSPSKNFSSFSKNLNNRSPTRQSPTSPRTRPSPGPTSRSRRAASRPWRTRTRRR